MDEKTPPVDQPATRTEGEGETLEMPEGLASFTPGQVLGDRYQILEMLGRGGMGEVWHAFDLKLRVEVALKALREDLFKSERRLELLRQEVRAAREVVSPNVCRIFDLIEVEDRELVSMEYVDGATLLGVLQERGPLELKEAQDIASQFLAGLEAIHKVGLIHRDIKPENIMLTRAGRVVVMDFGLARQEVEGGGSVSGTPAYMAPEQAAGQTLDARADVYAAGVVLAEMVSPDGIKSYESRQSLWEGVRSEPAKLPDSPWAPAIKKAVAKDREQRYHTAHTLTRALEDVTLRVEGAEDLHPYPGLASFTEEDAEYFFGREAEVEQMWRRLEGPPRLFAIMGPSGAGKSSFIAAGLLAAAPPGGSFVVCTPGNAAISSLGRAMAGEMAGDKEAFEQMMEFDNPDVAVEVLSRWRSRHDRALLVIDQFEELFTQNDAEEQHRFVELLGRLVLEADIFVVLSMRDDFLMRCRDQDSLKPIFADMTALPTLAEAALRRALVRPATKCGYRFEDDQLVEEMLAEVEGERGALPLLAFAAARLWEKRDRENGLLTRTAFHDIGGVGGALARHAEFTIDLIGSERIGIVRELFRNLVTAEGTRAVREWNDLLSIFSDSQSESPEEVLRQLIDARLLTSYEMQAEDEAPTRSVEIIHESLLAAWPRLVRWQTQDQEGAQLRDELRQSARSWDEHGRQDDRLWTGTAFREYQLWRERYPGALTETEEAFSLAMISHASRRRRRRRVAATAGAIVLLTVLAIVTGLWRHSVRQTRVAKASKLITLGHIGFDNSRTNALAFAVAALERADTSDARRLAVKALWAGPPATVLPADTGAWPIAFASDGSRMVVGHTSGGLRVYSRDGGPPVELSDFEGNFVPLFPSFSPDGSRLVSGAMRANGEIRLWYTGDWRVERVLQTADVVEGAQKASWLAAGGLFEPDGGSLLSVAWKIDGASPPAQSFQWIAHRWPLDGGDPRPVGVLDVTGDLYAVDPLRNAFVSSSRNELHLHRIDAFGHEPPRVIFRHPETLDGAENPAFDPSGGHMALCDADNRLFVWRIDSDDDPLILDAPAGDCMATVFSPDGSLLAQTVDPVGGALWDLQGPAGAEPLSLDGNARLGLAFTPDGRWLATASGSQRLALWPMTRKYNRILRGHDGAIESLEFAADSSTLYTQGSTDGKVLAWPLTGNPVKGPIVVHQTASGYGTGLAVDPHGRFLIVSTEQNMWHVPLDGGAAVPYGPEFNSPALDSSGRFLAAHVRVSPTVVVFDLETGKRWELVGPGEGNATSSYFDLEGRLLVTRGRVLSRWDPATATTETLFKDVVFGFPHPDGRVFISSEGTRWLVNLEDGSRTKFSLHGGPGNWMIDPDGSIVARGSRDGTLLVWSAAEQVPHLLLGHEGIVYEPRISPDGRWIASRGVDETVRLWPMPDLSKPPLNELPHSRLLMRLKSMTNLRVVPDGTSHTGYKIEPDFTAYHGWAEVPEW